MPMSQKLQHVHDQLMEIAKEAKDLSHKQYTVDDIRHLQASKEGKKRGLLAASGDNSVVAEQTAPH